MIMAEQRGATTRCTLASAVLIALVTTPVCRAQGTAGVSTGQGLSMGSADPYWHYIVGQVDYTSPGALLELGGPAVVDTVFNWDGSIYAWALQQGGVSGYPWSLRLPCTPGRNINNGWIRPTTPAWDATPLGPTTMRTFVDLTHRNIELTQLAGTVWADGCLLAIYVNGQVLPHVVPDTTKFTLDTWFASRDPLDVSRAYGYTFSISQVGGLEPGVNVVDFVWDHFNRDHRLVITSASISRASFGRQPTDESCWRAVIPPPV